jgi:hypothetical protein
MFKRTGHTTDWENTWVKGICDEGLLPKIYKEFLKLNRNTNNTIKKWAKQPNICFIKEDI